MAIHNEIELENIICQTLIDNGWLYSASDAGYDKDKAIFTEDLLWWIKNANEKSWNKLKDTRPNDAESYLLDRIAKVRQDQGSLHLLKNAVSAVGAGSSGFDICQFRPAFGFNDDLQQRYQKNRLRVVRQVHYSTSNYNSIDLVLFVNGISVATIELKTDFTQAVEDAKTQYRNDRPLIDPKTKKVEPLLQPRTGALVHFAASGSEVWMTTALCGPATHFLPFNQGNKGGKGNPLTEGLDTDYFWNDVLNPDAFLDIIYRFIQVEAKTNKIIFPRYHQWDCVKRLVEAAKFEGAGGRYLIQHSAGSGKSNTIAWSAHQLSTLHNANDEKVFDSVIVVTDRTVLDQQLKETITSFSSTPGVVAEIKNDAGSKSEALAKALSQGALVIIVTLQTFPHVMSSLSSGELKDKKFALIVDEAHSSQTGKNAQDVQKVLGSTEIDTDDLDAEDVLLAEAGKRGMAKNISYLAFTATPKNKTLEVFGRPVDPSVPMSDTNKPMPFHLYSMRQAIEEGFILDVLKNYLPYKVAYQLAHQGELIDDNTVDKQEGKKALAKWVKLHPHNISQKVAVIVNHFQRSVRPLLNGEAKAMVVTDSRLSAVRYKEAMDRYIFENKITDVQALVAFSGEVIDEDVLDQKYTESSMNRLQGQDIREAFKTDDYNVLIVANKFQTGFDQPKLCAMYVDKMLSGITAVQTLSRLNRTFPGKSRTYILDFVNDIDTIKNSFAPYYESTEIAAVTDPNLLYDIRTSLDDSLIYRNEEVENVARILVEYGISKRDKKTTGSSQKELEAALKPAVERFRTQWDAAVASANADNVSKLQLFRKNLATFNRLYDFLSQIHEYDDRSLETRYYFYDYLGRLIREVNRQSTIDLSGLVLTHYNIYPKGKVSITVEPEELKGITAAGTAVAKTKEQALISELVEALNDLFADEQLGDEHVVAHAKHLIATVGKIPVVIDQAMNNSESQFLESPDVYKGVVDGIINNLDAYNSIQSKVFETKDATRKFVSLVASAIYKEIREQVGV